MNDDILLRIEEYAGYFLTFKEIATLVNIDPELFDDTEGDAYKAYFKGKTIAKLEIRKNIIKLAKHGSPQAEQLAEKFIYDQKLSELE